MEQPKKVKFSSFSEKETEYNLTTNKMAQMSLDTIPKFTPKEEFTRIKFDPNVRHRLPTMPAHLINHYIYGQKPVGETMSAYVAVNVKGTTYHLFNAKRMPLGRMSVLISQFIRGKHKPGYSENNYDNGDKCIVVNVADPLLTGRKRQQKIYRHHTGYPGGLKELTFDTVLEKNPKRVLINSLLGMLPKNSLRKRMIEENVKIYLEPYHAYGNILPQFMEPVAADINEELAFSKENSVVNFISSGEIP